tara:strand:+ start:184 stop:348 length:165 start_codon:yes stop_codon:yes gene_type:complete
MINPIGNLIMTIITGILGWFLIQSGGFAFLLGLFCIIMCIVGIVRIFKPDIDLM